MFSSTAQTSPHIPGKAPATPHAPAARETSPILRRPEQSRLRENAQAVGRQEECRVTGPPKAGSESKKAVKAAYAMGFNAVSSEPRCSQYRTGEMYSPTPCELWAVLLKPTPNRNPAPTRLRVEERSAINDKTGPLHMLSLWPLRRRAYGSIGKKWLLVVAS